MAFEYPFVVEPLPLGVTSTGNERPNRFASHLGDFYDRGMVWQSNGATSLTVSGDFGGLRDVDFVGLLNCNATAATRARIRFGASMAVSDYDSGFQTIRTPALVDQSGLYHWHWQLPSNQNVRYWTLNIDTHTGDFSAMALVIGKRITFSNFYDNNGIRRSFEDMGSIDVGRYGVVSFEDGIKLRGLGLDFTWLSTTDRTDKFEPLIERIGTTGIAFWCLNPEANALRQRNSYFGWLKETPTFKQSTFDQKRWGAVFEIRSII